MSQTTKKIPLDRARTWARALVRDLEASCQRIEIAGSIRRARPEVGDIEICAIPMRAGNLFGERDGESLLNQALRNMEDGKYLVRVKGANRYRQYEVPALGCALDLFLCQPENWGYIFAIRTGPAEFSRRLVARKIDGGCCPAGHRFHQGKLWGPDGPIDTPEEADLFRALGLAWISPEKR